MLAQSYGVMIIIEKIAMERKILIVMIVIEHLEMNQISALNNFWVDKALVV